LQCETCENGRVGVLALVFHGTKERPFYIDKYTSRKEEQDQTNGDSQMNLQPQNSNVVGNPQTADDNMGGDSTSGSAASQAPNYAPSAASPSVQPVDNPPMANPQYVNDNMAGGSIMPVDDSPMVNQEPLQPMEGIRSAQPNEQTRSATGTTSELQRSPVPDSRSFPKQTSSVQTVGENNPRSGQPVEYNTAAVARDEGISTGNERSADISYANEPITQADIRSSQPQHSSGVSYNEIRVAQQYSTLSYSSPIVQRQVVAIPTTRVVSVPTTVVRRVVQPQTRVVVTPHVVSQEVRTTSPVYQGSDSQTRQAISPEYQAVGTGSPSGVGSFSTREVMPNENPVGNIRSETETQPTATENVAIKSPSESYMTRGATQVPSVTTVESNPNPNGMIREPSTQSVVSPQPGESARETTISNQPSQPYVTNQAPYTTSGSVPQTSQSSLTRGASQIPFGTTQNIENVAQPSETYLPRESTQIPSTYTISNQPSQSYVTNQSPFTTSGSVPQASQSSLRDASQVPSGTQQTVVAQPDETYLARDTSVTAGNTWMTRQQPQMHSDGIVPQDTEFNFIREAPSSLSNANLGGGSSTSSMNWQSVPSTLSAGQSLTGVSDSGTYSTRTVPGIPPMAPWPRPQAGIGSNYQPQSSLNSWNTAGPLQSIYQPSFNSWNGNPFYGQSYNLPQSRYFGSNPDSANLYQF